MKVLVTGACGFIGFELAKKLKDLGYPTIAFAHQSSKRTKNDFSLPVVFGDIRNQTDLAKVGPVDCIHHLAANADPTDFGIEMLESNILGTRNVLELAKKFGAKVIYASSAAVYGGLPPPHRETGGVAPLNAYAATKISSEYFCQAYLKKYNLNVTMLRYFNTYGIGEEIKGKDASIIFHFIQSVLRSNSVEIYGDGSQRRDFVFVEDAIQANILAMTAKGIKGAILNVGSGKSVSYNQLVAMIQTLLGRKIEIRYVPNPIQEYYQLHTQADLTRISRLLGYRPRHSLTEGIQRVLASTKV